MYVITKSWRKIYCVSSSTFRWNYTTYAFSLYTNNSYKNKEGKDIDKICCRDFWKGRDSYRQLQNAFHKYITSKGFDLERGLPVEETELNTKIEDLKKLTNFENTKKVLDNIKLELPETPDINDIKLIKLNKEKVENEIIKPKDNMIEKLYNEKFLYKKNY